MKKLIALLLALAMAFALVACGGSNPGNSSDPAASGSTPVEPSDPGNQTEDKPSIGFVILGLGSEFFQGMADGFVERFTEAGWEASYVNGEFSPEVQIKAIENYTAAGVDVLIVFPSEGGPVDDALQRAREAGIKVIEMVNCGENWDACMISDNYQMAEVLCQMTAAWANKHFADAEDRSVNVVVLTYYANDTNRMQAEGALRIEEYSSKLKLMAEYQLPDETTEAGVTAAENVLTMYPDVDIIISPQGTVMVGVNNYLTSTSSPITDYTDFALFTTNANSEEAYAAIAASANNAAPLRGSLISSGLAVTISDMYDITMRLLNGEEHIVSYATTEIVTADTIDEFLANEHITSYTLTDLIAEVGVAFYG